MKFGLEGRVALITGGASGIGRGIVEAFSAEGARVVLSYRISGEGARRVVDAINVEGGEALFLASLLADFMTGEVIEVTGG
jgi:NAD(P)-dependent dehydrogenase (short-subunit alcohol dehydrogenase family)